MDQFIASWFGFLHVCDFLVVLQIDSWYLEIIEIDQVKITWKSFGKFRKENWSWKMCWSYALIDIVYI